MPLLVGGATLFRCPNQDAEGMGMALAVVPHSTGKGATRRDRHLGPRPDCNVSALQRRVHGRLGIDPWQSKIADVGDIPIPRAN